MCKNNKFEKKNNLNSFEKSKTKNNTYMMKTLVHCFY